MKQRWTCLWCDRGTTFSQRVGVEEIPFCWLHLKDHSDLFEEIYNKHGSSLQLPWYVRENRRSELGMALNTSDGFALWDFAEVLSKPAVEWYEY